MQVRDLYWTFRNFRNRVADFLRYRRVTANMDERFGDATAEDLARCDGICIICREDLAPGARNKKLPCNHVFHMHCLRCATLLFILTHPVERVFLQRILLVTWLNLLVHAHKTSTRIGCHLK